LLKQENLRKELTVQKKVGEKLIEKLVKIL